MSIIDERQQLRSWQNFTIETRLDPSERTETDPVQLVGQQQYAILSSEDEPRYAGASGVGPCLGVVVFGEKDGARKTFIAHIDEGTNYVRPLQKFITDFGGTEAFLLGSESYVKTVQSVKVLLEINGIEVKVCTQDPRLSSFVVDAKKGNIEPDVAARYFWCPFHRPYPDLISNKALLRLAPPPADKPLSQDPEFVKREIERAKIEAAGNIINGQATLEVEAKERPSRVVAGKLYRFITNDDPNAIRDLGDGTFISERVVGGRRISNTYKNAIIVPSLEGGTKVGVYVLDDRPKKNPFDMGSMPGRPKFDKNMFKGLSLEFNKPLDIK